MAAARKLARSITVRQIPPGGIVTAVRPLADVPALPIAAAAAFPANRRLLALGKGHAVVHEHHAHRQG
jgi:hypothetical protein